MSDRHRFAVTLSTLLAAGVSACGEKVDSYGSTNAAPAGQQGAPAVVLTTTTTLPGQQPPAAPLAPEDSVSDDEIGDPLSEPPPSAPQNGNLNQRNSPLGNLCWATRAVGLSLVRQTESRIAGTELTHAQVQADYVEPLSVVDSITDASLTSSVRPFRTHFEQALRDGLAAPVNSGDSLDVDTFAFDSYPGAQAYAAAAGLNSDCVQF